ncbi:hypothetical protein QQ045_002560 [Rhodiola kirilowii]
MTIKEGYVSPASLHHSGQQVIQHTREVYGSEGGTMYNPYIESSGNGGTADSSAGLHIGINMNMWSEETPKKKRGRPRKYGTDGTMAFAPVPPIQAPPVATQSPAVFSPPHMVPAPLSPTSMRKRGRPRGSLDKKKRESRKKKRESSGSTVDGFIPHIMTVNVGENVAANILSFSENRFKAVCILSASGAISNVTLRQPTASGGTINCEGRFEILSLSGSFFVTESEGQRMISGGLSVSLSGPDGRVMGGQVAGLLIAASPVQVIIGGFDVESGKKPKTSRQKKPSSALPNESIAIGTTGPNSSPSDGSLSESSSGGGSGSPLNHHNIPNNNNIQQCMPWS